MVVGAVFGAEEDFDEVVDGSDATVGGFGVGGGLRAEGTGTVKTPGASDCCLAFFSGLERVDVWG